MSNVEDYGVKVNFDNSDFNDNIDSSEKKLNSFQDTLSSFTNSLRNIRFNGNINLGELLNFAAIQTGIYSIKNEIQSIGDPIESVADKALRVVNNVVNSAIQQIKSGGMQRALNIEAAKFQIEGLKLDVDTFMEAADYAVSGTAYSLDAAAKAASQLGASGITQLEDLKKKGFWVYGADMGGKPWNEQDYSGSVALVIGSEGKGLSRIVKEKCDFIVSLPMKGHINSLNASVAAGILMYKVTENRHTG